MNILKKRQTAVIVFVVVVIAFTLIGAHRSINKLCRSAENAFFEKGVLTDYDYYTVPYDHIDNILGYTNRLLSVINSDAFTEEYAAVSAARVQLRTAGESRDISDIYDAVEAVRTAVDDVEAAVQAGAELPPSNDSYDDIMSNLIAALQNLENCPYNQYIEDFSDAKLRAFPTNILRVFSGVKAPERFA